MKKPIHRGFFAEIFLQLRTAGIVLACILMLFNVGPLFRNVTALMRASLPSVPSDESLAIYMMLFIYIASFVLTFIAYNWLNRRSASDFYHALPIRRAQIFWSTFLAVVLWIAIDVTGYALTHAFLYLITGLPFNYFSFFCVYLNMLIGMVYTVGIVSLACALSGTRFVNLFASFAILLVPRALLMILALFIGMKAAYLPVTRAFFLFNPSYNIFASPYIVLLNDIAALYGERFASIDFCNPLAMLYSLAHACFIAYLGRFAFVRRASESAGMPMKNRFLQATIRIAFGLPLLLILAFVISNGYVSFYLIAILVLFAFAFYCLYELISTKSAKRMVKAMPLFGVCIVIAALYLFVPQLICKAVSLVRADENNIESFEIADYTDNGNSYYASSDDYLNRQCRSISIDNPQAIRLVARAYRHAVNPGIDENYYYGTYLIRIHRNNGGDLWRTLQFTKDEKELLSETLKASNAYRDLCVAYMKGIRYYAVSGLSLAEARTIGRLFEAEYDSLPAQTRLKLRSESTSDEGIPMRMFYRLELRGTHGACSYDDAFVISDMTPNTAQRYAELLAAHYDEHTKDLLRNILQWMETGRYSTATNDYFTIDDPFPPNIRIGSDVILNFGSQSYYKYDGRLLAKYTDEEFYEILKILNDAQLTDSAKEGVTVSVGGASSFLTGDDDLTVFVGDASGSQAVFNLKLTGEQYARIVLLYSQHEARENELSEADLPIE